MIFCAVTRDAKSEKQPQVLRLLATLVAQDDSSWGARREKQPRVLRLLATLVAQDDSSWGYEEKNKDRPRGPQRKSCPEKAKSNHGSFDFSLRSSLRMTVPGGWIKR